MGVMCTNWCARLLAGMMTLVCARRCRVCGGRMRYEHFRPPITVKDGVSGVVAKCPKCGRVEVVVCRRGP